MDKSTNSNNINESNVVFLSKKKLDSENIVENSTYSKKIKNSIINFLSKKSYVKKVQILIFIFLIGMLLFLVSPVCKLKMIVVLGDNTLTQEELIQLGKIQTNRSIYLISTSTIESRLTENPYVKNANITRKFPNKLIADLNMREEVATVNFEEGFAIIDHTGYILKIEQDVSKIVKPLITGVSSNKGLKVGQMLTSYEENDFRMILELISNIQNAGLIQNISEMNLQDPKNIYMITTQGLKVLLGDGEDLTYKLMQLSPILVDLHTHNITYGTIDMRFNSYPVYREN